MKKSIFLFILIFIFNISLDIQAQTSKDYNKFTKFIRKDRPEKVLKLIEKGNDINATNNLRKTPLLYSLQLGKTNFAEIFIGAGSDINVTDNRGNGCLHYSIEHCSTLDITYKLIDLGLDVNLGNASGLTPFHYSILYKTELPFYLIEQGADYNRVTISKQNAVHFSIFSGCDSLFNFLIENNVDFDIRSVNNGTPFLLAIERNEGQMAKILLEKGANISVKNKEGYSPLCLAIKKNNTIIFDALLKKGVNIDSKYSASNPINIAVWNENEYFVEQLLNYGAVNPYDCATHDDCYITAFIYSVSAGMADENKELKLYVNAYNIFNLTKEKYKKELNKIRARNTAIFCGNIFLILFGGYTTDTDDEAGRKNYLKRRISLCNEKIENISNKIESL